MPTIQILVETLPAANTWTDSGQPDKWNLKAFREEDQSQQMLYII